ncbi:unnamed protein product, partial [marine sediment metagenome]
AELCLMVEQEGWEIKPADLPTFYSILTVPGKEPAQ